MMNTVKCLITAVAVAATSLVASATDRTWTGEAGDGKWSTKGNWTNNARPISDNYDSVYLYGTNLVNDAIENDMGTLRLYVLGLMGNTSFTLNSPSRITVYASTYAFRSYAPSTVLNGDIRMDTTGSFYVTGNFEHNGTLEIADDKKLLLLSYYPYKVLTFNGPINGPKSTLENAVYGDWQQGDSHIYFNGTVNVARFVPAQGDYKYRRGVAHFCASGNEIGEYVQGYYQSYLNAENAFSKNTVITWDDGYRENSGKLYLTGAQQANRIVDETIDLSVTPNADRLHAASSTTAPVLTLYGTQDAVAKALVCDNVSIIWNPVGDYTQEFRDRNNLTTGDLIASNGTFRIGGSGTFNSVTKVVAAGGTFEVASTKAALTGLTTLEVGEGGCFRIASGAANPLTAKQVDVIISGTGELQIPADIQLSFKSVTVDGETLSDGFYGSVGNKVGATEVSWLTGGGLMTLSTSVPTEETTEATWDGGAADDLASSAENWVGDTTPDYATGGLVATFATDGTTARFDKGGVLKGIAFDAADGFAVTADKTLHLRQEGLTLAEIPAETTRTYALNGSYRLDCSQTWQNHDRVTLNVTGSLNHYDPNETLTLQGATTDPENNCFHLHGTNVIVGKIELNYARLVLGGDSAPTELNGEGGPLCLRGNYNSVLVLSNAVIRKPFTFVGGDKHRRIILYGSTSNTITGKITASWNPRLYINDKAVLVTEGGYAVSSGSWTVPGGSGKNCYWRICKKPIAGEGSVFQLAGITLSLEVPGNVYKSASIGKNSRLAFGCDYAISNATIKATFTDSSGEIDLGGHDVLTGALALGDGIDGATITSATPGVYGFTQTNDLTLTGLKVTGAASLAKYGAGTVTFDRAITSKGGLTVGEGTFTFGANGSWVNSSNIVVKGTGKLVIPASRLFRNKTIASVETANGACIELADGVSQNLSSLTVDGVTLPPGTYGGASAPAGVTRSAAFSDTGSGTVTIVEPGFMFIVR